MAKRMLWVSLGLIFIFSLVMKVDSVQAAFPEKKIKFIEAFAPGGAADLTLRIVVRYANQYLDGKGYVENILGASGAVGLREGAKAEPDGYTVTNIVSACSAGVLMRKDFPSTNDFEPIAIIFVDPQMPFVRWDSPFKTAKDLISYAKAHPEEVTFGISGIGSANHVGAAAFGDAIGVKFNFVPYGGENPALVAAIGGHVDVGGSASSGGLAFVKSQKLRPLVIYGENRSRFYPDVPTMQELGYDCVMASWGGLGVPKGTPEGIKNILAEAVKKGMETEECKNAMEQIGMNWMHMGSSEAASWIKATDAYYKKIGDKIGLMPE